MGLVGWGREQSIVVAPTRALHGAARGSSSSSRAHCLSASSSCACCPRGRGRQTVLSLRWSCMHANRCMCLAGPFGASGGMKCCGQVLSSRGGAASRGSAWAKPLPQLSAASSPQKMLPTLHPRAPPRPFNRVGLCAPALSARSCAGMWRRWSRRDTITAGTTRDHQGPDTISHHHSDLPCQAAGGPINTAG